MKPEDKTRINLQLHGFIADIINVVFKGEDDPEKPKEMASHFKRSVYNLMTHDGVDVEYNSGKSFFIFKTALTHEQEIKYSVHMEDIHAGISIEKIKENEKKLASKKEQPDMDSSRAEAESKRNAALF